MSRAVLSIGANLGDRMAALRSATERFATWLRGVSSVYETPPWGPVAQDDYLNAILVAVDDTASADDWLERAHGAEQAAGRTRGVRFGPRTLDVDVIDVDGLVSDDPVLTLPHPRAAQRAFVLVPWAELAPTDTLGGVLVRDRVAALDPVERDGVRRTGERLR